jgi:hypothetical protein
MLSTDNGFRTIHTSSRAAYPTGAAGGDLIFSSRSPKIKTPEAPHTIREGIIPDSGSDVDCIVSML